MAEQATFLTEQVTSSTGGTAGAHDSRMRTVLPLVGAAMFILSIGGVAAAGASSWRWFSLAQSIGWGALSMAWISSPRRASRPARPPATPSSPTDASEQRIAQAIMQRFQTLADLAPIGIFQAEINGDNLYVNDRWCEITGISRESARGPGWVRALHPEDRARILQEWSSAVSAASEFSSEYRYQRPDGTEVWVICNAKTLRDAHGAPSGYLGAVVDITARKSLESQMRESVTRHAESSERVELLRRELDHRVRNNLGSLLGLLRMYEKSSGDARSLAVSMRAVVGAMNDAHQLICSCPGGPVGLGMIVQRLVADASPGRVEFDGPEVPVMPMQITAMAMVLQELVSNSRKHGALGHEDGRVDVSWTFDPAAHSVRLLWTEHGRNVAPPTTRGTGLALIETLAKGELRGCCEMDFRPEGMVFTLSAMLDPSQESAAQATTDSARASRQGLPV